MVNIGLPDQLSKEGVGITQATAVDNVIVRDETIAPVQAKPVLTSTCQDTDSTAANIMHVDK